MLIHFYDIESLSNVFTLCNSIPEENVIDVYYLCDNPLLTAAPNFEQLLLERIKERNKNWDGTIRCYDLHFLEGNVRLAKEFGLSNAYMINDPDAKSDYPDDFRLVCDTDPEYDENVYPFLAGYNSQNYDTTMLAMYDMNTWVPNHDGKKIIFKPTTAKIMRDFNDELFSARFKESMPSRLAVTYNYATRTYTQPDYKSDAWRVRKNMIFSGRHLDVARLNEKQQKVALKRLLGMMGFQILESDKLKQGQNVIETLDQLLELIAYNCSDIVNLKELFYLPLYQGQFSLKRGLLRTYPELVYDKQADKYAPDISPKHVRRDRLYIDSSSAQLSTKALCPYGHLTDIPVVSFMYPSEAKSKEMGIPRVNVLEEAKKFFYSKFSQPEIRAEFDRIYNYYKHIEGRNFNESENYAMDYTTNPDDVDYHIPENIANEPKINMNMVYYNADGTPSNCYINFSTGGIHGAEYNKRLYDNDIAKWEKQKQDMDYVRSIYPNPVDLRAAVNINMPDGRKLPYKRFLKSGATLKKAEYRNVDNDKPQLFRQKSNGAYELNPRYTYTSGALANHEDFTSYYPNMLRMMSAFYNEGLGYDRYAEIFDNKQKYGKLMKDKSLSKAEQYSYSVLREGTKLILNSASGAADATFESNIRMNNRIISMRIIGQLFTWRIGQAQTVQGAQIISTNTDGLYSVLEASINDPILAKESADIGVAIEPEPLYLISKDSNNRIEMEADVTDVISASGGSLACRQGPNPTKSLAHPAILDWAMTEYLIVASTGYKGLGLHKGFDDTIGASILHQSIGRIAQEIDKQTNEPKGEREVLRMYQNVVASSPGSQTYIFATDDANPEQPIIMQHYNRVFIVKDGTPGSVHLHAACAKKLTPATIKKRKDNNERPQQNDPIANYVLSACGEDISKLPTTHETTIKKVSGIEEDWYMLIVNKSLKELTDEEVSNLLNSIDYDKYLSLFHTGYEENWMNHLPDEEDLKEAGLFAIPTAAKSGCRTIIQRENKDPLEVTLSDMTMLNGIA